MGKAGGKIMGESKGIIGLERLTRLWEEDGGKGHFLMVVEKWGCSRQDLVAVARDDKEHMR